MSGIIFRVPTDAEFTEVKKYVEAFWLDNENMLKEQFRILLDDGKFVAFGRLRKNSDATELCSLGVLEEYRHKGMGSAMVKHLLDAASANVYVVCVIPGFFNKQGFVPVTDFPASIQKKRDLCVNHYHVGIPYDVMKYTNKA